MDELTKSSNGTKENEALGRLVWVSNLQYGFVLGRIRDIQRETMLVEIFDENGDSQQVFLFPLIINISVNFFS